MYVSFMINIKKVICMKKISLAEKLRKFWANRKERRKPLWMRALK